MVHARAATRTLDIQGLSCFICKTQRNTALRDIRPEDEIFTTKYLECPRAPLLCRLTSRFPHLTKIDLVRRFLVPSQQLQHLPHPPISLLPIHFDDSAAAARFALDDLFLPPDYIDIGLETLSRSFPSLR
ncbi:hypothetical protein MRB53_002361 [Persea americana]|uniref:Uncharacterized protein n=1 Tax=Persea americana TaxID=3435 RepID=A0ACC2MUZ7_PERAE|nr:hypothetical protein MRB53_002361 [Persea americana]